MYKACDPLENVNQCEYFVVFKRYCEFKSLQKLAIFSYPVFQLVTSKILFYCDGLLKLICLVGIYFS